MFLTDKNLIFKSHKLNIQTGQTNIRYDEIADILKRKTAGIIDNGVRIKTIDGKKFDFVINSRENWINELNKKISNDNKTN